METIDVWILILLFIAVLTVWLLLKRPDGLEDVRQRERAMKAMKKWSK